MKQRHEGTLSCQGASETTREALVSGRLKRAVMARPPQSSHDLLRVWLGRGQ